MLFETAQNIHIDVRQEVLPYEAVLKQLLTASQSNSSIS